MPHFGNGCLNLRDLTREFYEGHSPKVILVAHALRTTDDGSADEDVMLLWLQEVDLVLSLNYNIQTQIEKYIQSLSATRPISHRLYLPGLPTHSWKTFSTKPSLGGEQNILLMATDRRSLLMSALNFELHVLSALQACHEVLRNTTSEVDLSRSLSFKMTMLVTSTDEKAQWQMRFKNMIEAYDLEQKTLTLSVHCPHDEAKLLEYVRRATIVLIPSTTDRLSTSGSEALVAVASGVPVLVSKSSGIASLLQKLGMDESLIWDQESFTASATLWKSRLFESFSNPERAQDVARNLRKKLLGNRKIPESQFNFMTFVAGKSLGSSVPILYFCLTYKVRNYILSCGKVMFLVVFVCHSVILPTSGYVHVQTC